MLESEREKNESVIVQLHYIHIESCNNYTVARKGVQEYPPIMSTVEQRINLKFLAKLGMTPSECFALLQQVYEETISRARVFEWHKRFREGQEECEDDQRSGRPVISRTDSNIDRVKQLVRADRRLTLRMISEELSIGRDAVWKILTENLEMRKLCATMVQQFSSNTKDNKNSLFVKTLPGVWRLNQTCSTLS